MTNRATHRGRLSAGISPDGKKGRKGRKGRKGKDGRTKDRTDVPVNQR